MINLHKFFLMNSLNLMLFVLLPSLIKQGSELHRNAARSLIYTDD